MKRRNDEPALNKIGFRVTDEEFEHIQARAEEKDLTLAEYCRWRSMGRKKL